jgi:hypothetical protein
MLIQKGEQFHLYNSKLDRIPGVNPVTFNSLEEYDEFLKWQRAAGIRCPVLYVQYIYDVNGEPVYKLRPSPYEPQIGLPEAPPVSDSSMSTSNLTSYYEGALEPQLVIDNFTSSTFTGNPIDSNWGGPDFAEALVRMGY